MVIPTPNALRPLTGSMIPPIGLGAMPMSWPAMVEQRDRALDTITAALDAGCRHIDTSNAYAPNRHSVGHNEALVAEALAAWSGDAGDVVVATKGGLVNTDAVPDRDGSAAGLRRACEASLIALDTDRIDLYYLHRADPTHPFVAQIEHLEALRQDGLIGSIGLSNISVEQLDAARTVAPIAAVQNEYSPRFREGADVLAATADAGIAFLPWSPFGGGDQASELQSRYRAFADVAAAHDVSVYQVCLAWLIGLGDHVIPIPGSTRRATIEDSLRAWSLDLSDEERRALDATVPEGTSQYPDDMEVGPIR